MHTKLRRLLAALLLLFTLGSATTHAQQGNVVNIQSGDEQALINAIRGANATNTDLTIVVKGTEPFQFDTVEDNTMGPSFLPPIMSKIFIRSELALTGVVVFRRAPGAPPGRFFFVAPGGSLLLCGFRLENGMSPGDGGAIKNQGNLTVELSQFVNNAAADRGGAIFGEGDIAIGLSVFTGNTAGGDGGAVSARGNLQFYNSTIRDNMAEGFGGGVDCAGGPETGLQVINTLIDGALGAQGAGGLHSNGCSVFMNNSRITRSQGDGAWLAGPTTINNSVFGGNAPNDCQVFGPPPTRNFSWFSDMSCGAGGQGNQVEPGLDNLYAMEVWDEIVRSPLAGPDAQRPFPAPPAYREAVDDLGMTGTGSPDAPGTSDTACDPIGLNGFPVVPPVAPCTPGVLQFRVPGEVPPTLSGHVFDPAFNGMGFNLQDLGDGTYRMEVLGYGNSGAQAWQSIRGYSAGPFIVFPARPSEQPPGPVDAPLLADIVVDPVGCGSGEPNELLLFPLQGDFRISFTPVPLTDLCPILRKAIQDGHSGGFVSDERPLDRFTLFILTRGEALFHWMTLDDEGRPAWFFGLGQFDGDSVVFDELFVTSGPTFPDGYDPADLQLERAGSATVAFGDCDNATLTYDISAVGGAGTTGLARDGSLAGTTCVDG